MVETIGQKVFRLRQDHRYESMTQARWAAEFRAAGIPSSGLAMAVFKGTSKYQQKHSILHPTAHGLYTMDGQNPSFGEVQQMVDTIHSVQHRHAENCKWRKYEEVKRAKAKLEANGYKVIG